MAKNYIRRGNRYYYMRRVPAHLAQYDARKFIRISLKTSDEREAIKRSRIYDDFIEKYWRNLIKSETSDADMREYKSAVAMAQAHGFAYKDMSEIATGPLEELLSRTEVLAASPGTKSRSLLGLVSKPTISLSVCPEKFWPLCADRLVSKNAFQTRKYMNPRNAAMQNFIKVVGNIQLGVTERSHILKFRGWLMQRIEREEITAQTANKQLRHVKDMLVTVGREMQIETDFKHLFAETRLVEDSESRPPFEPSFVQDTLLTGPALDGLNNQSKILIYMMTETGARESELIGLLPEDYFLNEEVPHVWIRKNKLRGLKTKTSERKIPLVGTALMAAKKIAHSGLDRYQKKPDTASTSIGKYFRENELKPTPRHSIYSLRHTFKDRLRDAGAPEEVIDELMGHKKLGPKYGRGHTLDTKHEWLQKIAFNPPDTLSTN